MNGLEFVPFHFSVGKLNTVLKFGIEFAHRKAIPWKPINNFKQVGKFETNIQNGIEFAHQMGEIRDH